jgi:hypothetical protein
LHIQIADFNVCRCSLASLATPVLTQSHAQSKYNESKVAFLVENRKLPNIVTVTLQMMSVIPDDWRFVFMGSEDSVEFVKQSAAMRSKIESGKLEIQYIPSNVTLMTPVDNSEFFTSLWLYEVALHPAEWILSYQTDSTAPSILASCYVRVLC